MAQNNQYRYFKIGPTSENPSEQALWAAIEANRAAKKTGNKGDIILSRQNLVTARQAFLAEQPAAQAGQKTFMRYAKPVSAEATLGHSPQLAQIVAPTTTRPAAALPVFKATPMPTTAQQIDLWLTAQRNDILYNFRDKRFDKQFYTDNALNPAPLNWAQKTESYVQQLNVSFKEKTAAVKNNVSTMGASLLQNLKKPAYIGLAALPMLTSIAGFGHRDNSLKLNNKTEKTTEKSYKSIKNANEALKDYESYKAFFVSSPMPNNVNPSEDLIKTLYYIHNAEAKEKGYSELPTSGGKYANSKNKEKRGNGGGASGAYQFMATTWMNLNILKRVETKRTSPNNAHLICRKLNNEAIENNEPYIHIPSVNKSGNSTGRYTKLVLTSEAKNVSGLENATDIFITEAGARLQNYTAMKLMLANAKSLGKKHTTPKKLATTWHYGYYNANGGQPGYNNNRLFKNTAIAMTTRTPHTVYYNYDAAQEDAAPQIVPTTNIEPALKQFVNTADEVIISQPARLPPPSAAFTAPTGSTDIFGPIGNMSNSGTAPQPTPEEVKEVKKPNTPSSTSELKKAPGFLF